MKSFRNPRALYRKICKWLKIDNKLKLKWLVWKLDHIDFEWREMIYKNVRKWQYLEIYHINRFRDYTEMYWVYITDKNQSFLEWYGPEQKK